MQMQMHIQTWQVNINVSSEAWVAHKTHYFAHKQQFVNIREPYSNVQFQEISNIREQVKFMISSSTVAWC